MSKYIIITSIHNKTPAIAKFENIDGWKTIIVGDKKTPNYTDTEKLHYFSLEAQNTSELEISTLLPENHYCRKNIGYLLAIREGAQTIFETDDDNLPYSYWGVESFESSIELSGTTRFLNVYNYFSNERIWPRGFPLDAIQGSFSDFDQTDSRVTVGVWQAMADISPDLDAIYRLINSKEIHFNNNPPIHLKPGVYCPFNSQATAWSKQAMPFMYLPSTVSFRFTDILRGYVAQRLMWEQNLYLGFTRATVYQQRNEHDLMRDFSDEVEMHLQINRLVNILDNIILKGDPLKDQFEVYVELSRCGIVQERELEILSAWTHDYNRTTSAASGR
jgi:hypothetical protein